MTTARTTLAGLATSALLAGGGLGVGAVGVSTADAAARHFPSCAAMQRVYPHGVGKVGAVDRTSGRRVRTFYHNTALYLANNGPHVTGGAEYDLDRDNDGIACEKL